MKFLGRLALIILSVYGFFPPSVQAEDNAGDFALWLDQLKTEAIGAGISEKTLEKALADIKKPVPEVIIRDRKQPEFTQTLTDYLSTRVTEKRIDSGLKMMKRYPTWLGRVAHKYGVQRRFLVSLWGIESNYGEQMGTYPLISCLVTLSYDGRRANYFRRELIDALHILDAGTVNFKRMQGSWAGAMGQCQFMPSSFRRYAVDADGNNSPDIWSSIPDVLASMANYLASEGWRNDQTWGRQVKLPDNFDFSRAGLNTSLPLSRWKSLGVRRVNGRSLPRRELKASLITPDGPDGPAYLVYNNFRVLLKWNRSINFAIAVGELSDHFMNR
jgi:membrane-bound lytic murein transglycosylase B